MVYKMRWVFTRNLIEGKGDKLKTRPAFLAHNSLSLTFFLPLLISIHLKDLPLARVSHGIFSIVARHSPTYGDKGALYFGGDWFRLHKYLWPSCSLRCELLSAYLAFKCIFTPVPVTFEWIRRPNKILVAIMQTIYIVQHTTGLWWCIGMQSQITAVITMHLSWRHHHSLCLNISSGTGHFWTLNAFAWGERMGINCKEAAVLASVLTWLWLDGPDAGITSPVVELLAVVGLLSRQTSCLWTSKRSGLRGPSGRVAGID